jgi:uncharacterized protein YjiS (DUF1127 family)
MLTLSTTSGPLARILHPSFDHGPWSALAHALAWPARAIEARRLASTFAEMDDRGLADIGLRRQDVRDMSGLAFGEDPSAFLAERRFHARRGQLRARSHEPRCAG